MISTQSLIVQLFRSEKRLVLRFAITSLGRAAASMMLIYIMQEFLSGELGNLGRISKPIVMLLGKPALPAAMAVLLLFTYVLSSFLNYDNRVVLQHTVKVVELGIMHKLVKHLLTLSVPFFNRQSHGDIIQGIRQDVNQLRMIVHAFATLVLEGVTVIGIGCVVIWLSPSLTMWAFIAMPIAAFPVYLVSKRLKASSFKIRSSGYLLFDIILQILVGIRVIKVYRGEKTEETRSLEVGQVYFDELIETTRIRALSQVLIESLAGFGIVLIIVIGGFQVRAGVLKWPDLFAFVMAIRALHGPITNMYQYFTEMSSYKASAERIEEILATKPDVDEIPNPKRLLHAPKEIRFENVTFGYTGNPILRGISMTVKSGETIGIVGPSGVGKSTLLNLIVRFYDPTGGRILFDDVDLRHLTLSDLYDHIAIVTQDPFLFATTVRENIRCGRPNATDEEVQAAAVAASIHETIMELPQGYDTDIGVGGRELSRGQAQRINVARAILKSAPILLLDEATSSLDSVAEAEVQLSIDQLMLGRTSFVVAHRLSTLRNVDRLLVLSENGILGLGTHDELLATCELYRRLWRLNLMAGHEQLETAAEIGV